MALDLKKKYGSRDPKSEAEWFEIDGAEFLIAPNGNIAQQRFMLSKMSLEEAQHGKYAEGKTAYQLMEMEAETMAKFILLDWRGLEDDGQELPYSEETAKELLMDYLDLRTAVTEKATELADRKGKLRNEAKKKSGK